MAVPVTPSLIEHFAALEDPRQSWKVLYPLPEMLLLVLCGTLAGAEDFVEIRRWGRVNLSFLQRFLPYAADIPSHDTLNDVVNAIDGELFAQCFSAWVEGLRGAVPDLAGPEVVAIDGKTSRRTHDRGKQRGPLHLVSAWASQQRPSGGYREAIPRSDVGNADSAAGCFAVGSRRRDRAWPASLRGQVQRDHRHRRRRSPGGTTREAR